MTEGSSGDAAQQQTDVCFLTCTLQTLQYSIAICASKEHCTTVEMTVGTVL